MELSLVLGAGCFWGVELLFEEMNGVIKLSQVIQGVTLKTLHMNKYVLVKLATLKL